MGVRRTAPAVRRPVAMRGLVLVAVTALLIAASYVVAPGGAGPPERAQAQPGAGRAAERPNIVVFLTDDMSAKHLRHMPSTRRLVFGQGARFTNYHTNVSLCCPARASLLTGKYAHNTGITGNEYPDGFWGFHTRDERRRTVAVALRRGGYTTSLLGKYLNEYPFVDSAPRHGVPAIYVPPGWSRWAVPVRGQYEGTSYDINLDGRLQHREGRGNYLGDFLVRRAVRQVRAHRGRGGLMVLLSFYGPHKPEPASPVELGDAELRDRVARIRYPRTPDFDERVVRDKPRWVRTAPRLGPRGRRAVDRLYRRQVLSVTSIDRHVRVVVRALRRTGQLDNTYLVFTSDNGVHMGEHRLPYGKNSAYQTDAHLPFAICGPGVPPGSVVRRLATPMDLAPTIADIAGVRLRHRHDGRSLLPLARGDEPRRWRRWVLVQRGQPLGGLARRHDEPLARAELQVDATAPPYRGVLGPRWTYVRYDSGEQELYDQRADPYQLSNIMARPRARHTDEQVAALRSARRALRALRDCAGVRDCRR